MKTDEAFMKKIGEYLKKDIEGFIKAVSAEFNSEPFTIYGLNVSVYLRKSERNNNMEEVYEVYSLDCSQNLPYYNIIWKKYLENYQNKFSHFEFNGHTDKGWYDKDVVFSPQANENNCCNDEVVFSEVQKEEKPNTEVHFINVDDGWIKFINELENDLINRAFNLSWVSSYIHIPNSEFLDYPKWYVSCYLLVDVGNKINDKRFYKSAFRPAISKLLFNTSLSFHELLIENKQVDLGLQATRAAISQVMARNTSHNIGAHVMNKLIGDLNYDTLFEKKNYDSTELILLYTDTIKKWNQERQKDKKQVLTEEEQNNKILLDQISIFNNYVKCRMDYLADISFGTPLMQTNKYAYADLFKELDKVRLLLEHISGLDDFKFEIKFKKNGNDLNDINDLLVAIPNDILGTQAFYNILENIIRNSAKHAQKPTNKDENGKDIIMPTIFTVNFIDTLEVDKKPVVNYCNCNKADCNKAHKNEIENALNEFIAVEVYDSISLDGNAKGLDEKEIKEFNDNTRNSGNQISKIEWLVYNQNKKLNENILIENSKLRSYSLGLVEMDASAAYLRKRPVEYINHQSYDIQYDESWSRNTEKNKEEGRDQITYRGTNCRHFLKAFKKIENDKNYLGYRFFLHRPAVVLVVTDHVPKNQEELKKQGIWVITPMVFAEELKEGKVYSHEFVVLDDCIKLEKVGEVDFLEYYKTSLPIRVLKNINELSALLAKSTDEIEKGCWEEWFENLKNNNPCENHQINHNNLFFSVKENYNADACHSIVLLDHLYKEDGSPDIAAAKELWSILEELKCFVEALSSLAQAKLPSYYKIINQYCKNEMSNKKKLKCYIRSINQNIKQRIAEAVFAKVVVIDERIQEAAESRDFMTIKFDKLYKKMNVIIPKKDDINLSANSYDVTLINKLNKYLGLPLEENAECSEITPVTNSLNANDFILIHYSIFERMFKKDEINNKIEEIANKGINVVITSGRGTPENLTPKVRFVNLSSVINAFVDIRSKYLINYLLNSSRKSNKI